MNMVTYFNEGDMISFGKYLLSGERRRIFEESYKEKIRNGINDPLPVDESLMLVHHSDFENWKYDEELKRKKKRMKS